MAAVVLLGLDGRERGVGEHRVIAPDGKQLALTRGRLAVEVTDAADDQPGGDLLPFLRGERGVFGLGATWASEIQQRSRSSQIARGYLMGVQAVSGIPAIAALTAGFIGAVTGKKARPGAPPG
jgi:hypothetical protein